MSEAEKIESSQRQWHETLQHQEKMNTIVQEAEYALFAQLKPKISIDGNQYCVLLGENLHDGIAGFGDTLYLAILNFNKQFNVPVKTLNHEHQ